jgi:hypothetical protein
MIIKVTGQDIKKANKNRKSCILSSNTCPVAQSLMREFPNLSILVGYEHTHIGSNIIDNTIRMKRFIDKFDNRKKVKPCNFRINV